MVKLTLDGIKAKLSTNQLRAAELLLEKEYAPKGEKKTYAEIAEELGIDTSTLYHWRQNTDFVRYLATVSDTKLDSARAAADAQLMRLVNGTSNNGNASIKALEMYYKLIGKLTEKREIIQTTQETQVLDVDAIKADIERLRGTV
ncbi:phBC6A51 family helix-turn-helix protein [Lysinibacillus sp. NPDC097195]|uniref:phBC6A51 family helix-turn-helix protein n=1 Tax=Lysinibacillus sp. NPDC097195 TaxID=3364141 RepID=UPI003823C2CF